MKKIKSYTGIWNVEKVLYAINDFNLPFPVTFTQITWFVITEFLIILFGDIPPLSMIEGAFLKYFGIPPAESKKGRRIGVPRTSHWTLSVRTAGLQMGMH